MQSESSVDTVTKRDKTREPFDRQKIFNACMKAGANNTIAMVIADECPRLDNVDDIHKHVERELILHDHDSAVRYVRWRSRVRPGTELEEYIHVSKYAREVDGRRESFLESVRRVERMHVARFPDLEQDITRAFDFVREKKVLPSMRSLQFGGPAIEQHNARMFNCSFTRCDRPTFFSELFYLLLCGCGVGYSVQKHHVAKLPPIAVMDETRVAIFKPHDTIEGWSECVRALMEHAAAGIWVEFDYSDIRPKGSTLSTSVGKAPGHIPLKRSLEKCREVLLGAQGRQLAPLECHEMACFIAQGVLAGGVRRSSLACLFSKDDISMRTCKTGEWYADKPHLAMSNNSAVLHAPSFQDVKELIDTARQFGEPGIFFSDDPEYGTNPCFEIGLNPCDEGVAFCNLTEINLARVGRLEWLDSCWAATFIGTLQAQYRDMPYLQNPDHDDALLGVSITGYADCSWIEHRDLEEGAEVCVKVNASVCEDYDWVAAQRVTCVKPSGTASLLLGCSSGIHPHHAKRYIRRVTANEMEPCFQAFRRVNPEMCRQKPDGDWVIEFPVETDGTTRHDWDAEGFMEEIMEVYFAWVATGHRGGPPHNVSATVTVKDDEWDKVASFVHIKQPRAMSFIGVHPNYDFAPREEVKEFLVQPEPVSYTDVSGEAEVSNACEGKWCST